MSQMWTYSLLYDGQRIELQDGEYVLGRSKAADISIPEKSVSRKHTLLTIADGRIVARDLESSNGTYINNVELTPSGEIGHGDQLALGDAEVEVQIEAKSFQTMQMSATSLIPEAARTVAFSQVDVDALQPPSDPAANPEVAAAKTPTTVEMVPELPGQVPAVEPIPAPEGLPGATISLDAIEDIEVDLSPQAVQPPVEPALQAPATNVAAEPAAPVPPPSLEAAVPPSPIDLDPAPSAIEIDPAPSAMPLEVAPAAAEVDPLIPPPVEVATGVPIEPALPSAAPAPPIAAPPSAAPPVAPPPLAAPAPPTAAPPVAPPSTVAEAGAPLRSPFATQPGGMPYPTEGGLPADPVPAAPEAPAQVPPAPAAPTPLAADFASPVEPPRALPVQVGTDAISSGQLADPDASQLLSSLDLDPSLAGGAALAGAAAGAAAATAPVSTPVTAGKVSGPVAAGFGRRALAFLLDSAWIALLTVVGTVAVSLIVGTGFDAASLTEAASVEELGALASGSALLMTGGVCLVVLLIILLGWAFPGTTPGKRLMGLYVCTPDGKPGVGIVRAFLRMVGYLLSYATLGVGFLMIAFTASKRGLHDLVAGTIVVRR